MCFFTRLKAPKAKIEKTMKATFVPDLFYEPQEQINGFAHAFNPVVLDEDRGHIVPAQWGLVPFWAKDDAIRKMTLNARIETAEEKPAFRSVTKNRCLVIADGFYEWQWLDPKGKNKQKYLIRPKDQEIFGFAGLYSDWKDPESGNLLTSYTIVTTAANDLMAEIHNNKKRMPVIISEADRNRWLNGDPLQEFEYPYEVPLKAEKI